MTDSDSAGKPGPRRKGRSFHQAGAGVKAELRRLGGKRGFAEPDVLLRWDEIAGPALAATCRPVSVRYEQERRLGATLIVEAPGARAPEVQMTAPRILEAVNRFYGYRAVTALKVRPARRGAVTPGFAEPRAAFQGPAPRPDGPPAAAREKAGEMTAEIADPALRAALTTMGAWVLSQPARRRKDRETSET